MGWSWASLRPACTFLLLSLSARSASSQEIVSSTQLDGDYITMRTSLRVSGAIDSVVWRKFEFVNDFDHGREIQSASTYFGAGECFNPTEAGSRDDGVGRRSTSQLLAIAKGPERFSTQTRMAFWLAPGEKSGACHGSHNLQQVQVSDDILDKTVSSNPFGLDGVFRFQIRFSIPERRTLAGFEPLTGYFSPDLTSLYRIEVEKQVLRPVAMAGEGSLPVIASTPDGRFAVGFLAVQTKEHLVQYGAWSFLEHNRASKTIKLNFHSAMHDVGVGKVDFECYILFGTLADVVANMAKLQSHLGGTAP